MKSCILFSALAAMVVALPALPLQKRDLVWVTDILTAVETVDVYTTVWVTAGAEPTSVGLAQISPGDDLYEGKGQSEGDGYVVGYSANYPGAPLVQSLPPSVAAPSSAPVPQAPTSQLAPSQAPVVPTPPAPAPAPVTSSQTTTVVIVTPPVETTSYVTPSVPVVPVVPVSSAPVPSSPVYSAPAAPSSTGVAPAPSGNCNSGLAGGECTDTMLSYFNPALGACGITNTDADAIFAISETFFDAHNIDSNPNNNPLCGRMIMITAHDGTQIPAKLTDRCVGCADLLHLDLSPSLWNSATSGDPKANGLAYGYTWEWQ